jgi:hypothetical protein
MRKIFLKGGNNMNQREARRDRVARWREKKFSKGYKPLFVYLSLWAVEMMNALQKHLHLRRRTAKIIESAIELLFDKYHPIA